MVVVYLQAVNTIFIAFSLTRLMYEATVYRARAETVLYIMLYDLKNTTYICIRHSFVVRYMKDMQDLPVAT